MQLSDLTWIQAREAIAKGVTAIVPLGSLEEHGPHTPMGDYLATAEIAREAADLTGDVVAPVVPFGYSECFRNYPGTITLRAKTFAGVLTDIIDCLLDHGFRRVTIFNGHDGNAGSIEVVARRFRRTRGILIPSIAPLGLIQVPEIVESVYGNRVELDHGGEPMGSLMMHVRPGRVRMELAGAWGRGQVFGCPTEDLTTIRVNGMRVMLPLDMEDVAPPTGSLSDPKLATPERGKQLFQYAVDACARFLSWFRNVNPYLGGLQDSGSTPAQPE